MIDASFPDSSACAKNIDLSRSSNSGSISSDLRQVGLVADTCMARSLAKSLLSASIETMAANFPSEWR